MNNYDLLKMRAFYANNDRQHNRMVKDKQRSFHRALLYSYQTAWIKKDVEDSNWIRALINPDKVKFDYDEKILSVDWEYDFHPGDTFEWPKESGIHWIILKQELTELAYFRGNIRRCQLLEITDPETGENLNIWAAIRGPVETKINTIQKRGIVADVPNLTLDIYMVNTEQTRRLFERYCRFSFGGRFWKVQAPDSISTPGVLEVTAEEDYECHGDELILGKVDPNPPLDSEYEPVIEGDTFIKPLQSSTYICTIANPDFNWSIESVSDNKDIEDMLEWQTNEDGSFTIKWIGMVSGSFILSYGPIQKTIVVESLF